MATRRERASQPEDLARLWVERSFAGDAEGLATLRWGDLALTGTYSADKTNDAASSRYLWATASAPETVSPRGL